jgi:hypothetical protein
MSVSGAKPGLMRLSRISEQIKSGLIAHSSLPPLAGVVTAHFSRRDDSSLFLV